MLNLTELQQKLQELPLLPAVVTRLLTLSPNDEDYFEKVLGLAEEDPPLALRIIKLSNSASSAPMNPITNLHAAIVRIGANQIASMITSMAVMRVFLPSTPGERNLWYHAIQVAVGSRLIAQTAVNLHVDPEEAYLSGLLHDIGRFVLFEGAPEALETVDEANWTTPKQLVDLELEIYGFNHAELGWHVCRKWNLPELINDVVRNHHIYELPEQLSRETNLANLIRIVQMADFFSVFLLLEPDALSWDADRLEKSLNEKCIHPACSVPPVTAKQLQALASKINDESNNIASRLGISVL